MTPHPIIFIGSDLISLKAFNPIVQNPALKVKGVMTLPSPNADKKKSFRKSKYENPVMQKAKEMSLPVWTPSNLKEPKFLSQVENSKAKWVVLLSYGKILPTEFLSLFEDRALNFHAGLLPQWRGAAPVQRAIMAGDKELSMTLQVMKAKLDTGPLIASRSFKMTEEMDAVDAFEKMGLLIPDLLKDMLKYMEGRISPVPQEENQAGYAKKIDKKECLIAWDTPALSIFNKIRALADGPQAYSFYKGKRLKIYKAQCVSANKGLRPYQSKLQGNENITEKRNTLYNETSSINKGELAGRIEVGSDDFTVTCQQSVLRILKVQPESKKIMSAGEYIRGYHLKTGDRLE